jgi:hypothetical protein
MNCDYQGFEIESFEVGRGLWHARFRRADHEPVIIDGVLLPALNVGFAWPDPETAIADAKVQIDHLSKKIVARLSIGLRVSLGLFVGKANIPFRGAKSGGIIPARCSRQAPCFTPQESPLDDPRRAGFRWPWPSSRKLLYALAVSLARDARI